jgi:hypothetical protein
MNIKNSKRTLHSIEILEDVKIIYKCGKKDFFDAVHITEYGIITGRIATLKRDDQYLINNVLKGRREKSFFHDEEIFIECGFIPIEKIYKISGDLKKKVFWRK